MQNKNSESTMSLKSHNNNDTSNENTAEKPHNIVHETQIEVSNDKRQNQQLLHRKNDEPISLVHVRLIDKTKERTIHLDKSRESPENNEDYPIRSTATPERLSPTKQPSKEDIDKPLNVAIVSSESIKINPPKIIIRSATEDETLHVSEEGSLSKYGTAQELKITESTENLVSNNDNNDGNSRNLEKYDIKFVALRAFSPEPIRKNNEHTDNVASHSTNAFTTKPVPPDRRRSVKDIIASINKSQSLLKMNQDAIKTKILNDEESNAYISENNNLRSSKICEEKPPNNIHNIVISSNLYDMGEPSSENNYSLNDIPIMVEKFDEFNNNNNDEIFKKCNYKQDVENIKNANTKLEWNPVPKPRRSKNLANDDIEK